MASIGYDGSIRVWNVETMQMVNVIEDKASKVDKDQKINALAWQREVSAPNEEILCIGTAAGILKMIDVKKNKILLKQEISKGSQIFDIDWSIYGIAVASEDQKM